MCLDRLVSEHGRSAPDFEVIYRLRHLQREHSDGAAHQHGDAVTSNAFGAAAEQYAVVCNEDIGQLSV